MPIVKLPSSHYNLEYIFSMQIFEFTRNLFFVYVDAKVRYNLRGVYFIKVLIAAFRY